MNFLAPMAFWFAASIPVVILFYLLKRKRVAQLVSSTLLWQKFLAETQASAPFQKLRHNWLLLLQILLLLLIILALSRPYFAGKTEGGRIQVVILDSSASMQSTDESPSRFEKARAEALKLVDAMHDDDQMMVLQASANTEVKQSLTTEKAALRRAIQACFVTDTPTRLQEGLKLAETLIRDNPKAEVHLFSDGAVGNLDEFENSGLPLVFHRFGQRGNNIGLTSLDVRPNPENPLERALFVSVVNYSTNKQQTQLELSFDDQVLEAKSVTLEPRQSLPQVFIANQEKDGVFSVRLTSEDDLAVDNNASIVSLLPTPARVLLVSSGNQLLEKVLRVTPNVQLSVASTLTDPDADFDLIVLDGVTPLALPRKNVLAINTANTNWFTGWSKLEGPPIVGLKSTHPLLRFVSFDNVFVNESIGVETPTWAVSLVEAPKNPLILAGELGRQRIVWIGFDILNSSWPLRISFPIFIANAVEWLNPAAAQSSQLMVQAGSPFRFSLPPNATTAEIRLPNGTTKTWNADQNSTEFVFADTFKQGVYKVSAGTNNVSFCVNLLESAESDTVPKGEIKLGKYAQAGTTSIRKANMEIWRWIAAGGLLVLMFEWWYYHRRTA